MFAAILFFGACKSPEESYLDGFESFVERIEREAKDLSDEDWKKNDACFSEFVGEKYDKVKGELSYDGKKKVGELTARYCKSRAKASGKQFLDLIESGKNLFEGFAEEIMKELE